MESGVRYFLGLAIARDLEIRPEQVTDEFIHELRKYQESSRMLRMPNDPPMSYEECMDWYKCNKIWAKLILSGIRIPCGSDHVAHDLVLDEEKHAKYLEIKSWAMNTLGYYGPIC